MNPVDRTAAIRDLLEAALHPADLEVTDDSNRHSGHAGARDGKGHFQVRIVAEQFRGRSRLERHRMVYAALSDLMRSDIHALAVDALSTEEAAITTTTPAR